MLRKDCKRSRLPKSRVRIRSFFLRSAPVKCPLFAVDTLVEINMKHMGRVFVASHLLKERVDHLVKLFPLLHHIIWMFCLES